LKKILLLIIVFIINSSLFAKYSLPASDPYQLSMGMTSLGRYNNGFVLHYNPSLLHYVDKNTGTLGYQRLYQLSELDLLLGSANYNLSFIKAGFAFLSYGTYEIFNETYFELALSKSFFRIINAGLRIDYHQIHFYSKFDRIYEFSVSAGVSSKIDDIILHVSLHDLNEPRLEDQNPRTRMGYRAGVSFQQISYLVMNVEISGQRGYEQRFHFGQEIILTENFIFRFGLITNPTIPSAGLGIKYRNLLFNYAISRHTDLGDTHSLSLTFRY